MNNVFQLHPACAPHSDANRPELFTATLYMSPFWFWFSMWEPYLKVMGDSAYKWKGLV